MESPIGNAPPLVVRAFRALKDRGPGYVRHKAMRRLLGRWPEVKRRVVYADARTYWTHRGGDDYFQEQEGQPARSERSEWFADRVAALAPRSILEVGCGYGKQIRALRDRISAPIVGLDFSPTQLHWARGYLAGLPSIRLVQGHGASIPLPDKSVDCVLTSAVVLHNPPEVAEAIRRELVRVARRYVVHNEDTDVSYNRFGYDSAEWYRSRGVRVVESCEIPFGGDPGRSQFCVARV